MEWTTDTGAGEERSFQRQGYSSLLLCLTPINACRHSIHKPVHFTDGRAVPHKKQPRQLADTVDNGNAAIVQAKSALCYLS